VSTQEPWTTPDRIPAPLEAEATGPVLIENALEMRADVATARREVAVLEDALHVTRRWRWLGDFEVGYERESESDGSRLSGPTVALEVPLFHQNQGAVLRAQSNLEAARARLEALELGVRNEVALDMERLTAAREITELYRALLVPERAAVVRSTREEFNYMLVGAFELLQARAAEFDTWQRYLEAVRDYWTTRAQLGRSLGLRLSVGTPASTIGVEEMLQPDAGPPAHTTPPQPHEHPESKP
jgi:cobalt-zinc-cadmium efflux system outer membrane protein